MEDEQWDFFLAHAADDMAAAEELYDALREGGRVFLDSRCLLPGDDWDQQLRSAQALSRITVVLVSARTEQAYYQREEVAAALDLARHNPTTHRVIPVYLDSAVSGNTSIPYGLRLKHGLSVLELGGLSAVAEKLLTTLDRVRCTSFVREQGGAEPLSANRASPRPRMPESLQNRRWYLIAAALALSILIGVGVVLTNIKQPIDGLRSFRGGIKVDAIVSECLRDRIALTLVNHGESQVSMRNLGLLVYDSDRPRTHDLQVRSDITVVKPGESISASITANIDGIPIIFPTRRAAQCRLEASFELLDADETSRRSVTCNCPS